jgi:hypothetical protein
MSKDDKDTTTTTTTFAPQAPAEGQVDKQGEVVIDQGADANTLKEQTSEERLEDARQEGLRNHAVEHADDEGDVTSRDKTAE